MVKPALTNFRPVCLALAAPERTRRVEPATHSPPVFLVCGYNDRLTSINPQLSTPAKQNGLRANDPKPAGKWIERFEEWLADSRFLKKP